MAEESIFKSFFDNVPFMMGIVEVHGEDLLHISGNTSAAQFFGSTPEAMQNHFDSELGVPPEITSLWIHNLHRIDSTGSPVNFDYQPFLADHSSWLSVTVSPVRSTGNSRRYGYLVQNVSESKRMEKAQEAIYRISQATVTTRSLSELYSSIHTNLQGLMPVDNFYIALYDRDHDLICFPYFIDQYDEPPLPQKSGHGLTEYVLRSGHPLLASKDVFSQLKDQGEVQLVGSDSIAWLGVPLKGETGVMGVMVAQSYTDGIQFYQKDLEVFEFVSTQIGQAIERKSAEEQIYQNIIQSKALAEISAVIGKVSLDYHAVLDEVSKQVATLLGDVCMIFLENEDGKTLHPAEIYSPEAEKTAYIRKVYSAAPLQIDFWMTEQMGVEGQPLMISDATSEQILSVIPGYQFSGPVDKVISSVIIVPLRAQHHVMGALCVIRSTPGKAYSIGDQSFLQEIADRTAMAIANATLYIQEQERSRELSLLNSLSSSLRKSLSVSGILPDMLAEIQQLFKADAGLIALTNQDTSLCRIVAADGCLITNVNRSIETHQGIPNIVLQSQKPFVTSDYWSETDHCVGLSGDQVLGPSVFVPLQSEIGALGVLMVSRLGTSNGFPFTNKEVQLLTTIGEMVGNSIRRTVLYEDAQRRLRHTQSLHVIDTAISSNRDLKNTLNIFLEQVITQLKVDAACVLVLTKPSLVLEFAAGQGFKTEALQHTHLQLGEGYAGIAANECRIINIPNLHSRHTDFLRSPYFGAEGFVTYYAIPLLAKSQITGVLEIYQRTQLNPDPEWLDFAQTLAGQAAIAIENSILFSNLEKSNVELIQAYEATIEGWSFALDLRDKETEGHTRRVTDLSLRIADAFGLNDEELVHVKRGALLHDIGKMGIPDPILLKPGPLTDEEWKIMRKHPDYAREMLAPIAYLGPAMDIPYCHHEKWDGTGYPRQLKGEQIPLIARIFAVVDVWDALRSNRPYRPAWSEEKTLEFIQEQAGKHFDPSVIDEFLKMIRGDNQSQIKSQLSTSQGATEDNFPRP